MVTSYVPAILAWADVDADTLATLEREADNAHERALGMTDTRVNIMVANAFNGLGDAIGSDDYGYSVAWLDLADHLETYGEEIPAGVEYDNMGAYLATWRDASGCRYILAYIDDDGTRSAVGYDTRDNMMTAYRALEADYLAWEDSSAEAYAGAEA